MAPQLNQCGDMDMAVVEQGNGLRRCRAVYAAEAILKFDRFPFNGLG